MNCKVVRHDIPSYPEALLIWLVIYEQVKILEVLGVILRWKGVHHLSFVGGYFVKAEV